MCLGVTPKNRRRKDNEMNAQTKLSSREAISTLASDLAELTTMTVSELAERYKEVFGIPTRIRNEDYMRKRIAWRIQELAEGGLSNRALARIDRLAPGAPVRWKPASNPLEALPSARRARDPRLPPPGTVLSRHHGGTDRKAAILEDGFEYEGTRYGSLSMIARQITGTPWNGFLFFGLKKGTTRTEAAE